MDLKEYLYQNRLSQRQFAKMINFNLSYICSICCGRLIPGKKLAKQIEIFTNGIVLFDELRPKCNDKEI
jgi:ribosome-binding protein aMBF1 (putative translation factor)